MPKDLFEQVSDTDNIMFFPQDRLDPAMRVIFSAKESSISAIKDKNYIKHGSSNLAWKWAGSSETYNITRIKPWLYLAEGPSTNSEYGSFKKENRSEGLAVGHFFESTLFSFEANIKHIIRIGQPTEKETVKYIDYATGFIEKTDKEITLSEDKKTRTFENLTLSDVTYEVTFDDSQPYTKASTDVLISTPTIIRKEKDGKAISQTPTVYDLPNIYDMSMVTPADEQAFNETVQLVVDLYKKAAFNGENLTVHCSAGLGRAGAFGLAFVLLDDYEHIFDEQDPQLSQAKVKQTLAVLRFLRPGVVQKPNQYMASIELVRRAKVLLKEQGIELPKSHRPLYDYYNEILAEQNEPVDKVNSEIKVEIQADITQLSSSLSTIDVSKILNNVAIEIGKSYPLLNGKIFKKDIADSIKYLELIYDKTQSNNIFDFIALLKKFDSNTRGNISFDLNDIIQIGHLFKTVPIELAEYAKANLRITQSVFKQVEQAIANIKKYINPIIDISPLISDISTYSTLEQNIKTSIEYIQKNLSKNAPALVNKQIAGLNSSLKNWSTLKTKIDALPIPDVSDNIKQPLIIIKSIISKQKIVTKNLPLMIAPSTLSAWKSKMVEEVEKCQLLKYNLQNLIERLTKFNFSIEKKPIEKQLDVVKDKIIKNLNVQSLKDDLNDLFSLLSGAKENQKINEFLDLLNPFKLASESKNEDIDFISLSQHNPLTLPASVENELFNRDILKKLKIDTALNNIQPFFASFFKNHLIFILRLNQVRNKLNSFDNELAQLKTSSNSIFEKIYQKKYLEFNENITKFNSLLRKILLIKNNIHKLLSGKFLTRLKNQGILNLGEIGRLQEIRDEFNNKINIALNIAPLSPIIFPTQNEENFIFKLASLLAKHGKKEAYSDDEEQNAVATDTIISTANAGQPSLTNMVPSVSAPILNIVSINKANVTAPVQTNSIGWKKIAAAMSFGGGIVTSIFGLVTVFIPPLWPFTVGFFAGAAVLFGAATVLESNDQEPEQVIVGSYEQPAMKTVLSKPSTGTSTSENTVKEEEIKKVGPVVVTQEQNISVNQVDIVSSLPQPVTNRFT